MEKRRRVITTVRIAIVCVVSPSIWRTVELRGRRGRMNRNFGTIMGGVGGGLIGLGAALDDTRFKTLGLLGVVSVRASVI